MIPGILISVTDTAGKRVDFAYVDYWSLITQTGSAAEVRLPDKAMPRAYPDKMFGFDFARVNPIPLGITLPVDVLEQSWKELENEGLPLEELTQAAIMMDIITSARGIPAEKPGYVHHYQGTIPSFSLEIEVVGHISELRGFSPEQCIGLEKRIGQLRRNLNKILKKRKSGKNTWATLPEFLKAASEANVTLASKESEFNVLKHIVRAGHSVNLTEKGADFVIVTRGNLTVEVKMRNENVLENLTRAEQKMGITGIDAISIVPESLFSLVSWASFASIRRAMDEQLSQVLFCDISHTFIGWFLPAIEQFWKLNLDFQDATKQAFDLAETGKHVIVVFASLPSFNHILKANVFTRDTIEPLGKLLWDMNKKLDLRSHQMAKLLGDLFKQGT